MSYFGIPFGRTNDLWMTKGADESKYEGLYRKGVK